MTTYIKVLDMVINVWIKKVAKGKLYILKQDFASFQRVQEFLANNLMIKELLL